MPVSDRSPSSGILPLFHLSETLLGPDPPHEDGRDCAGFVSFSTTPGLPSREVSPSEELMPARIKLALLVAAALVAGLVLWGPRWSRSGAVADDQLASPPLEIEVEERAIGPEQHAEPARPRVPADAARPDESDPNAERRTEMPRLGSIRGFFTYGDEPLRSSRVILQLMRFWDEEPSGGPDGELVESGKRPVRSSAPDYPVYVETWNTVTDQQGAFQFEGLPMGHYLLTAKLGGGGENVRGTSLEAGQALNLRELRIPGPAADPSELVRIHVHAYDNGGPVRNVKVQVRREGKLLDRQQFLNAPFSFQTDRRGQCTLELGIDAPISIELVSSGFVVGGTGAEQFYAKGELHELWLSVEKGHLEVTLPQRIELARGQALQFVVESALLSNTTVRSATIIGGLDTPPKAGVDPRPDGCRFLDLPRGTCSVTAVLLEKDESGAWRPSGVRFQGAATVVGGSTETCALWRS